MVPEALQSFPGASWQILARTGGSLSSSSSLLHSSCSTSSPPSPYSASGGIELNPAMAGIVASPFVHLAVKAGTLLLIMLVALIAETKVKGSAIAFYCVIITLYLFIIVNNAFVLISQVTGF